MTNINKERKVSMSHYLCFLECPLQGSLPSLPDYMSCHLLKHCTGFSCCVNVPVLKRSFSFYFDLDSCNFALTAGVEKLEYNQSLINYEFGNWFPRT